MSRDSTESASIAVTGAAGYLGSRILGELQDHHPDWELTAIDNFYLPQVEAIGELEIADVDIRDREALEAAIHGADVVIHLAAISGVDDCEENPELAYETNVQGTNNVAWFCRKTGAAMIFPFSMAVLGDPETFPITADLPRKPMNWYGRTKFLGELSVGGFAEGAFPAHMLLKSNLYGHHEVGEVRVSKPTVTNFFVDRALAGEPLTVYAPGTQARNYLHVKEAADAYVRSVERLLQQRDAGETGATIYEIASEEDPSVMELGELVSEVAAKERDIDVPVTVVENPRSNESLVEEFSVDISRAQTELGWSPRQTLGGFIRELLSED